MRRLGIIPNITVRVDDAVAERSTPNTRGRCLIAIALRLLGYERVEVTTSLIKVCIRTPSGYLRFFYPTPAKAARIAEQYDLSDGNIVLKGKFQLRSKQGAVSIVQPRPDMVGHKGRGKTKRKRSPSDKFCVRRHAGMKLAA